MEDKEIELYADEVEQSRVMQESLGTGIGLFQVGLISRWLKIFLP